MAILIFVFIIIAILGTIPIVLYLTDYIQKSWNYKDWKFWFYWLCIFLLFAYPTVPCSLSIFAREIIKYFVSIITIDTVSRGFSIFILSSFMSVVGLFILYVNYRKMILRQKISGENTIMSFFGSLICLVSSGMCYFSFIVTSIITNYFKNL